LKAKIYFNLILLFVALFAVFPFEAHGQEANTHTSTIRGKVIGVPSRQPVLRAKVIVQNTKLGAITSAEGEYRIENVPVGHYTLIASAPGYSSVSQEVIVSSAHQSVVDFELKERVIQSDTIMVAGADAFATINQFAAVSTTPFSIQDVTRYAAAFQDPSRMAQNFAGVFGRGTTNNYIVVRGGSPIELLWKLDGIDIPNPNHFGKNGSSGGVISAINSYMLGNSDFLTGAFPAQYGTRLSGVFDLHTRKGNTERMEGMAQISFNGLEALGEGPLPGIKGGSALLSYRHSTLGVLHDLGLLDYNELPDFDDAALRLFVPIGQSDQLNATGLWGDARINVQNTSDDELGKGSGIGVGGIEWQHLYSDEVLSHVRLNYVQNRFNEGFSRNSEEIVKLGYATAEADVNITPNNDHTIALGGTLKQNTFTINSSQIDTSQSTDIYEAYANWKWSVIPQIALNAGLFSQFITYNHSSSYEPRVSLAWSPSEEHTIAAAFGVHRQPEPIEFAQALHYVLGYTFKPEAGFMVKAETYYKDYSRIPIHAHTRDSYSFLNEGFAERIDFEDLINVGTGRSYGAELTLLKHYSSGYYITATGSYIRQEFAGSDGIWHFGAFDNRYILNALAGYDFALGASSYFTLSEKFTIAGGGMYTPFDMQRSAQAGYGILDTANAYSARNPDYIRLDVNAEFHFNWQSSALTIYLSVLNALDIDNITNRFYSASSSSDGSVGVIKYDYDLPILPILGIRYEF